MYINRGILAGLLFIGVNFANAATLNVDNNDISCNDVSGPVYCTIQGAINASIVNDEILVNPGTYPENININKDVAVKSVAGPETTTIAGQGGTTVSVGPGGDIEGFTITGGTASFGAGMKVSGAAGIIKGNIFDGNYQSAGGYGAGIGGNSASATIEGNIFRNHYCDSQHLSGVVAFVNGSTPVITNNIFESNDCRAINMTLPVSGRPVVTNNTIVFNRVGIHVDTRIATSQQVYRNNIIAFNGVGLETVFGSDANNPTWESNLVFGNTTDYDGTVSLTGQSGNISTDPGFIYAAGGDYRLSQDSAAIDSASSTDAPALDFKQASRPVDGDNNGSALFDIGAYELSEAIAFAGPDRVVVPGAQVVLDETKAAAPTGIISYSWTQVSGPTVLITNANTAQPGFDAPTTAGTIVLELTVEDNAGANASDTVSIKINQPPSADAGAAQTVTAGTMVTLDGSNSRDDDGQIVSYAWSQVSGTPVAIVSPNSAVTQFFTPQIAGELVFRLTVTDNDGSVGVSTTSVYINVPPIAVAGLDSVHNFGDTVELDGTASFDANGNVSSYFWEQMSGEAIELDNANSATPSFTAPVVPGAIVMRLTVTDDQGASDSDLVSIHINTPPSANAGADMVLNYGETLTINDASVSDVDGYVQSILWTQSAGLNVTISNEATLTPSITAPFQPGLLPLFLTASDNDGGNVVDSKEIRINAPPVADAGQRQQIAHGDTVELDGSNSFDSDGSIASYLWEQVRGELVEITDPFSSVASFVAPDTVDTYIFRLTVVDNDNAVSTLEIAVDVGAVSDNSNNPDQAGDVTNTSNNNPGSSKGDGGSGSFSLLVWALLFAIFLSRTSFWKRRRGII